MYAMYMKAHLKYLYYDGNLIYLTTTPTLYTLSVEDDCQLGECAPPGQEADKRGI